MAKSYIRYRSGYKYQLATSYSMPITIKPTKEIKIEFITLDTTGTLTIKAGYAWDGPSGPVVDTKENMRASLVHDALYQLMRLKKLSATAYRDRADKIFKNICIADGIRIRHYRFAAPVDRWTDDSYAHRCLCRLFFSGYGPSAPHRLHHLRALRSTGLN